MKAGHFYTLTSGFIFGIMLGTTSLVSYSNIGIITLTFAPILLFFWHGIPRARYALLFLAFGMGFGFFHAQYEVARFDALSVHTEIRAHTGTITRVEKRTIERTTVLVYDHEYRVLTQATVPHTALLVGDVIRYNAAIHLLDPFVTDTGRVFDYASFARARNLLFATTDITYEVVGTDAYYSSVRALYAFRDDIAAALARHMHEPEAGLAQAMLLGLGNTLADSENQVFREVGLVHIVVLSGFHIMAIFGLVVIIAGFVLSYRARFVFAFLFTFIFSVMVGLTPTVVRALIMAGCVAIAFMLGRGRAPLRSLIIAACIITFSTPYALLYDVGFQFSFLATFAIMVVTPVIALYLRAIPTTFHLREIAAATISIEFVLTPLLAFTMGTFPVMGTLANILVLPMVPLAMLSALFVWISSLFALDMVGPVASLATMLHEYIIAIAHLVHGVPFAYLRIASFSLASLAVLYGVSGAILAMLAYQRYGIPHTHKSVLNGPDVDSWTIETIDEVRARTIQKTPEGALATEDVS